MDVAHGPSPFQTSPPPPRPAIPPKPDKDKIAQKAHAGTQANFRLSSVEGSSSTSFNAQGDRQGFNFRSTPDPSVIDSRSGLNSSVLTTPPPVPGHQVPISPGGNRNKPALPPKPTNPAILSSPPTTKFPGSKPSPLKIPLGQSPPPLAPRSPVDNSNNLNNNQCASPPAHGNVNGGQNGVIHSPPPFLRNKPSSPPAGIDQLSPRAPARSPSSRPNSTTFFNFASPIQNLNSANFPSTSGGLNQVGGARFTSPTKIGEIRAKSASLGRNITFPFTTSNSSSSSIAGIISRKSQTLSKFLPLDLQLGSGVKDQRPPATNVNASKPPKPNSLNLNPFIIQQKQQQSQMALNRVQGLSGQPPQVLSFGRSISFSPDSPLPPPPPPRLRKKLSPVNSLGSPTSPTSPSPFMTAPTGPLPPPPVSPLGVFEETEENKYVAPLYAEIDKQKKWADRKVKFEQSQFTPRTSILEKDDSSQQNDQPLSNQNERTRIDNSDYSELNGDENLLNEKISPGPTPNPGYDSEQKPVENEEIKSWLGKYIKKPASSEEDNATPLPSENNPFRSATPTYQSAKTGHIYETIGELLPPDNENYNNNNNNNDISSNNKVDTDNNKAHGAVEVQESAELITDELSENPSFLFKLVINHKKASEATVEQEAVNVQPQIHNQNEEDNEAATFISADEEMPNLKDEKAHVENESSIASEKLQQKQESSNKLERNSPEIKEVARNPNHEAASGIKPYLIPTVVQEITTSPAGDTKHSPGDTGCATPETFHSTPKDNSNCPSRTSSILRRRSWNCDRVGSPSPSESSSTTSSSVSNNLPYHRRDRSYTGLSDKSNRDSLLRESDWVDEGDLSNGALADAESSDVPLRSSAEDIIHLNISKDPSMQTYSPPTVPNSKGFGQRRRNLVNSFFGSFGKGSSSSSAGSSGKKNVTKRPKDRAVSHILAGGNQVNPQFGSRLGRQVSDSVLPTTMMISSPVVSNSTSFDSGLPTSKPSQSVQFSANVAETRIIYHDQYSSGEDVAGTSETQNNSAVTDSPQGVAVGGDDNESVSSSESVTGSASGSVSGHEEILAELDPKQKKSFYVAREILTSERTFVDVLNLLTIDFPRILINANRFHGQNVINREDLDTILGGLPNLKRVNEELLSDLEERIANWKELPKIADILVKKGPFLKLYADYIKGFEKNSKHLDTCCQKYPLFGAALKDFELSERCQKLGLKHYMLKPVQRMPQYRLLLEDYLKSLDKDSEDYKDTVQGIAIVKDVAEHANEAIRLQVNAQKLLNLQNRLPAGTIILKADRQLVKEGELLKASRKVLQPRFFALMNDCLLCMYYHASAGSPKDLKLRYELPLAGMRVHLNSSEDYQNEFSVISVTRSFKLVAKSLRERDEWMRLLNDAIHDNIKKRSCSTPDQEIGFQLGKEAPVWVQDSRVTMCQLCTAEFTPIFRRHHCRACGKVVCGNCSGNKAPLQYLENSSKRVCDFCYEYLLEEFDKLNGLCSNDSDRNRASLRDKFKKETPNVSKRATKIRRAVPSRLEVHANSSGSRISGYLHWREKENKSWKKRWFVIIDRVLYVYLASEDIVAQKALPLLGWKVEMDDRAENNEENQAVFRLTHLGHHPILFQAENVTAAEKWMAAMNEAVVL